MLKYPKWFASKKNLFNLFFYYAKIVNYSIKLNDYKDMFLFPHLLEKNISKPQAKRFVCKFLKNLL